MATLNVSLDHKVDIVLHMKRVGLKCENGVVVGEWGWLP